MTRTQAWRMLLILAGVGLMTNAEAANVTASQDAAALKNLYAREWQYRLKEFPERATSLGEHRYDAMITDNSLVAISARRAHHLAVLKALQQIHRAALTGEDGLSYDVMLFNTRLDIQGDELFQRLGAGKALPLSSDSTPFEVTPMSGPQLSLPQLARATRFSNVADYEHYLKRLSLQPQHLTELTAILEAGRAIGMLPPHAAMGRVPDQFNALINTDMEQHALYAPFKHFPDGIDAATQAKLQADARAVISGVVIPALVNFKAYLRDVYLPATTTTLGATELPHGAEYYQWALTRYNTTSMTPKEIHELGLKEVARIDAAMLDIMREVGFNGSLSEFRVFLRTDKRFQFNTAEEELAAFRDLAKRIDPQLPSLFAELPRLPYGVRAMSPEEGNNAPHYIGGALDGSRAGYFEANTNNLAAWPKWTMESLVLHEAVPGHHLQIARAQELKAIPELRRASGNSGYSEGWGLYSEGLGQELGLYQDPYSRFGRLSLEAHRACRLVVDTGLHAFGWTREQAINYLIDHAQLERGFAEAEVDRYLTWPGQATAYKVGEQRILALRAKSKAKLGDKFDIRRFHNAILDHGALPLTVLDQAIEAWIQAQQVQK
jgi:uncharacterized protein (DUF885 family)